MQNDDDCSYSVTFDKLADKDRSMTIDGGMNIDEERRRRESAIQMAIGDAPTMSLYGKKKRSAELGKSVFFYG